MRKFLCTLAVLTAAFFSFAENWFVCLSSFANEHLANDFREKIAECNVPSFVYKSQVRGNDYYRVLLLEPFDTFSDAKKLAEGMEKPLRKKIEIKNSLWVCKATYVPENEYVDGRIIKFKNGNTGEGIPGANVTFDNNPNLATKTNNAGDAPIPRQLSDGEHSFKIESEDFVTTNDFFTLKNGILDSVPQVSLSPKIDCDGGSIKIILDWGEKPADLDSHILNGTRHVFYNRMHSNGDDEILLDRDDTTSFGPETVTVLNVDSSATYEYFVFNYSDKGKNASSTLSESGARVRLYINNDLIKTYKVPENKAGLLWHVFDICDGERVVEYDEISTEMTIDSD